MFVYFKNGFVNNFFLLQRGTSKCKKLFTKPVLFNKQILLKHNTYARASTTRTSHFNSNTSRISCNNYQNPVKIQAIPAIRAKITWKMTKIKHYVHKIQWYIVIYWLKLFWNTFLLRKLVFYLRISRNILKVGSNNIWITLDIMGIS